MFGTRELLDRLHRRDARVDVDQAHARKPMRASDIGLSLEHLVWVVGSLCQLVQRPADARLIAQRHPPPATLASLEGALADAEFRTAFVALDATTLDREPLPLVALLRAGDPASVESAPLRRPALMLKVEPTQLLVCLAGEPTPHVIERATFSQRFEPFALRVRHEPVDRSPAAESTLVQRTPFGFGWFWSEALRYRRVWAEVIVASAAITAMGLAVPLATQVVLDKVVVHETYSTLAVIACALAIFVVFSALMTWLRQYLVNHTGTRIDAVLSERVFAHLLRLPIRYFEQRPTGTIVARIRGVETIREFITGAAVTLVLDLPMMLAFLAFMFWYSWQLSLIAVGALALVAVLSVAITPALRKRLDAEFLLGARNQAFTTEYLRGVETVKSLSMEARTEQRYGEYIATHLAATFATRQLGNTYSVVSNALEQAMGLAILCVGAMMVMRADGFTIGMLVAFQMFASRLSQPLLRMVSLWPQFQQADIAVKRLADLMDAPSEPYTGAVRRATGTSGRICIEGLAFRYSERHPLLYRDLNLVFEPGTTTVIRGASGSGKSTLAKLLLGLYTPTAGRILLDGRDLTTMGVDEVRRLFGVVPQETLLFSNTLYDNLISAAPHARFEDVVRATVAAGIHDTIEALPEGYDTVVGEQGVGLSGGQRQRIAIARALLRAPRVLLFDEATSALDADTAEQLAVTVNTLRSRHTVVFVAHHVPEALAVDQLVKIDG